MFLAEHRTPNFEVKRGDALENSDPSAFDVERSMLEVRRALSSDLQPLGKALAGALQAGDGAAFQGALRKISARIPEFLESDAMEDLMADEMVRALLGEGEEVENAGFRQDQFRDLRGRWTGEADGGGGSGPDINDSYRYVKKREGRPYPAINGQEWAPRLNTKIKLKSGETVKISGYNVITHQITGMVEDANGHSHAVFLGADDIVGSNQRGGVGSIAEISKGRAAAERILATHKDEVGAFTHPEIGPIDFRWGNSKGGIRHIEEKHGRETVLQLPQMMIDGKVRRATKRVYIEADSYTVMLATDLFNAPANHWVLTGYMHHEKEADGTGAG